MIELVHGLREKRVKKAAPLWDFWRTTAWKKVVALMKAAGIKGPQATPKGLRHGFGVAAVQAGVPSNIQQRLLGHAQLTTTAIYANAMGAGGTEYRGADVGVVELIQRSLSLTSC